MPTWISDGADVSSAAASLELASVAVAPCSVRNGTDGPLPSPPTKLLGALSTREAARLQFYSDGFQTVLGPRGWSCQALLAADGSQAIDTPGSLTPAVATPPAFPSVIDVAPCGN